MESVNWFWLIKNNNNNEQFVNQELSLIFDKYDHFKQVKKALKFESCLMYF